MRQLALDPHISVILVGGENLPLALRDHAETQNLFAPFPVDYFDRANYWGDFLELVRAPIREWFDVTDEAVAALYGETAGHPYFTKMISERLFDESVRRRDAHWTADDIAGAARAVAREANASSFAHFWRDAIFEPDDSRAKAADVRRRLALHGMAYAARKGRVQTADAVADEASRYLMTAHSIREVLSEFTQRGILVEHDDVFAPKVDLFGRWLVEHGPEQIVVTTQDLDLLREGAIPPPEAPTQEAPTLSDGPAPMITEGPNYPTSDEILRLAERWGTYRGQAITTDHVRRWLAQFGDPQRQRLALRFLQRLRFYSADALREVLKHAGDVAKSGLQLQLEQKGLGSRKRRDIAVSYIDGAGKSGAQWARNFAQQHGIHLNNVLEQATLSRLASGLESVRVLVFLDDFIGTGDSASSNFKRLARDHEAVFQRDELRFEFVAAAGFDRGITAVENQLADLGLPVQMHVVDVLDDSDRCFSDRSHIYPDPEEREAAEALVLEMGERLSSAPLGHRGSQAAVVFADACPNNTLPVLWQERKTGGRCSGASRDASDVTGRVRRLR